MSAGTGGTRCDICEKTVPPNGGIETSIGGLLCDSCVYDVVEAQDSRSTSEAAATLGRIGGSAKSAAKIRAAKANGKLGGRPRKEGK